MIPLAAETTSLATCCLWPSDQNLPLFVDHALLDEFGEPLIYWLLLVAIDRAEDRLDDLRLGRHAAPPSLHAGHFTKPSTSELPA